MRERGNWETWLEFFLDGVTETAQGAFATATRIVGLFARDRDRIAKAERAGSLLRVYDCLQKSPFLTAPKAVELTSLSMPTVNVAFQELQRLGIVDEITGQGRGRVWRYKAYVELLNEGA